MFANIIFCFCVFLNVILSQGQWACRTPTNLIGQCIDVQKCQFVMRIVRDPSVGSQSKMRFLAGFKCDEGKACCPLDVEQGNITSTLLPGRQQCGKFISNKVVGGTDAGIKEFPWAALLEYDNIRERRFMCGGTLISDQYVVTAGHCIQLLPHLQQWTLIGVRLGETDLSSNIDCDDSDCNNEPIDVAIEKTVLHPGFSYEGIYTYNDVALLRLQSKITFTDFIKPTCLPITADERNDRFTGKRPMVTGWGVIDNRSTLASVKQKLALPVVSFDECLQNYPRISPNYICAGGEAGRDSCSGDSGGGLALMNDKNNWILAGMVSFGRSSCGTEGFPGVYVRIGPFMRWIVDNLEQ